MSYKKSDFTHLYEPEADLDIWQCNHCGAFASTIDKINHFRSCVPKEYEQMDMNVEI